MRPAYYNLNKINLRLKIWGLLVILCLNFNSRSQSLKNEINLNLKKAASFKGGLFDSVTFYLDKAAALNAVLKNDSVNVEIASIQGAFFLHDASFEKAFSWYLKAYELSEKKQLHYQTVTVLNQMGKVYTRQKNPGKALEYYLKALSICNQYNFQTKKADLYNNIGYTYLSLKNYGEGEKYHLQALKIRMQMHDSDGLGRSYSNLAYLQYLKGNLEQSRRYFYEALNLRRKLKDQNSIIRSVNDCADIENQMKNYTAALTLLKEALALEALNPDKDVRLAIYLNFNKVYNNMGNLKEAYLFQSKYYSLKDSIFSTESSRNIEKLESKHQLESKQAEIAMLKKDNDIQSLQNSRNETIIFALIGGFFLVIVSLFITLKQFRDKRRAHMALEQKNQIIEDKQKEILDSIHYAKRIQTALITSDGYINKCLNKLKSNN
ncbi:MAG: protein serine/threonine phosphatase [Bacteroidetes bacterium]|nr:protein serine/threonine phosphatase [Bacteroidota bacterium]